MMSVTRGQMTRIVVAVDPAVTAGEDSDDTGIMVVGTSAPAPTGHLQAHRPLSWSRVRPGRLHVQAAPLRLGAPQRRRLRRLAGKPHRGRSQQRRRHGWRDDPRHPVVDPIRSRQSHPRKANPSLTGVLALRAGTRSPRWHLRAELEEANFTTLAPRVQQFSRPDGRSGVGAVCPRPDPARPPAKDWLASLAPACVCGQPKRPTPRTAPSVAAR